MTIIAINAHVDTLPNAHYGTGLGVATLISNRHGHQVVEGEGGRSYLLHVCFQKIPRLWPELAIEMYPS